MRKQKQFLNASQMAKKIHALMQKKCADSNISKGKSKEETLLAILSNYAQAPRSIEPVAAYYAQEYKKPLYLALNTLPDELRKQIPPPLLVFLQYGGGAKR